jgi:hypothetical protein
MRYNLRYALGLCELLRQLHHQPRDGDATGRPQEFGLIRVLHPHCCCSAHDILGVGFDVVSFQITQLLLKITDFLLQVHHIVARYLAAFGGVVIFAVRVCPLTGPASRQSWIASCFALGEGQW